jgi:hypothetical protein
MLIVGGILLLLAATLRRENLRFFNQVAILVLPYSGKLAATVYTSKDLDTRIGAFSGIPPLSLLGLCLYFTQVGTTNSVIYAEEQPGFSLP